MTDPTLGLSLRELVLEIRQDVKLLDEKIDKIDRDGSIGTREDIIDHEGRLRSLEKWRYGIPAVGVVAVVNAVAIWLMGTPLT